MLRSDEASVHLAFGFAFSLNLSQCQNGQDMTDGLVVRDNGEKQAQITVHLDPGSQASSSGCPSLVWRDRRG